MSRALKLLGAQIQASRARAEARVAAAAPTDGSLALAAPQGPPEHELPWPAAARHPDGRLMTRTERRALADADPEWFARTYLSHHFDRDWAPFHKDWAGEMRQLRPAGVPTRKRQGHKLAKACFRGSAKSTAWSFLYPLHGICTGLDPFMLLISATMPLARQLLTRVRVELETNVLLHHDYGYLVPQGGRSSVPRSAQVRVKGYRPEARRQWTISHIETTTGMRLQAAGAGAALRGVLHRSWRPTSIVLDDLETDKKVLNVEIRDEQYEWLLSAVLNLGDTYTHYVYVGTLLHPDSVLNRVLKKAPGWRCKIFRAVIRFADRQDLWQQWRQLYTDKTDENALDTARAFFDAHREEMLQGAEVIWPAKLDYYQLMCILVDRGEISFAKEYQQEPRDATTEIFQPKCWDDPKAEIPKQFRLPWELWSPEFWANTLGVGALDPSLGKNQQKGAFSAIILLAVPRKVRLMYCIIADIQRRPPDKIITDLFSTFKTLQELGMPDGWLRHFGVEAVQFQQFLADEIKRRAPAEGVTLPVKPMKGLGNKELRIESLQPDVNNGFLLFSLNQEELLREFTGYGQYPYVDGPDAVEMAKQMVAYLDKVAVAQTSTINRDQVIARPDTKPGTSADPGLLRLMGLDPTQKEGQ